MKKTVLVLALGVLVYSTTAQAEKIKPRTDSAKYATVVTMPSDPGCGATTITQNNDPTGLGGGMVACGSSGGGYTTENFFARSFDLSQGATAGSAVTVNCVDVGVGQNTADFTITINLYADSNGGAPDDAAGDLVLLGSQDIFVPADTGQLPTFYTATFATPVAVAANTMLVVEAYAPDLTAAVQQFRPSDATNPNATGTTYLKAAGCGITSYTAVDAIGFADSQIVFLVDLAESFAIACGDGVVDPNGGELCDGAATGPCPALCGGTCWCADPICGNGITEPGEECDGADDGGCAEALGCEADCTCTTSTCPAGEGKLTVVLDTDTWGSETGWTLVRMSDSFVVGSVAAGDLASSTHYQWDFCQPAADCYAWTLTDAFGDGGPDYDFRWNDVTVVSGGGNWGSLIEATAGDDCPCPESTIHVILDTDTWPSETSWELLDGTMTVIASETSGTLAASTHYDWKVCVPTADCYTWNLLDAFGDGGPDYDLTFDAVSACSGGGNWGDAVSCEAGNCAPDWCDAGTGSLNWEYIEQVDIGTISNGPTAQDGYTYYDALSTDVIIGVAAPISVIVGGPFSSDVGHVWADWNADFDFEDAGEHFVLAGDATVGPLTGDVTAPAGALEGQPIRMRVAIWDGGFTGLDDFGCGLASFGEVEDYNLNVLSQVCGNGDVEGTEECDGGDCCTVDCLFATGECRGSAGDCDVAESCTGASADCPADGFLAAGTSCRAAAGECDAEELCDGQGAACGTDLKLTTECRPAAGDCDEADFCDGQSDTCGADNKLDTECRASTGSCDPSETCDGGDNCPADVVIVDCTDGDGCCAPGCNANNDSDCTPECGNGVQEEGEECDDGNDDESDACTANCTSQQPVPTVSEWGLVILALLLLAAAKVYFGRRTATA